MLGKRPRPPQRTCSKMQFMPDGNLVDSPAIAPLCEKPKLSTPLFGVPRQVIGFNPVSKDIDADGSPRSVLSGVGSGCSQVRSPRSPRSGLESLLSPRPLEKKGTEGVGLGIVAALSTTEDSAAKNRTVGSSKGLMIHNNQQQLSAKHSEPIPIGQPDSLCSPPGWKCQFEKRHSHDDRLEDSPAWSFRGLRSYTSNKHEHPSPYGALADVEMEIRESIFSTASPVSSCSENSDFLLDIDFLNSCYFCKRQLGPGKDIYMYRGDRAFCTVECRYQQIVLDERKERCCASVPSTSAKHRGRHLTARPQAAA